VDKLVKVWKEEAADSLTAAAAAAVRGEDSRANAGSVELSGHQGPVFCTAVDQCNVFSGGSDGLVLVWDFHSETRGGTVEEIWETGLGHV